MDNQTFMNQLVLEEIKFSNKIADGYHYPDNITHLLYLIVPAFILKYGISNKMLVENCFENVPILIQDKQDKMYQAYYFSKPILKDNQYKIVKGVVLNNYQNISLMQMIDNLVHEFNHAINSMKNEMLVDDTIRIRNGLVYHYFDKENLSYLRKNEFTLLEEVINTKETEMIIDIIRSFSTYTFTDSSINTTLYSIYHSVDSNYHSNSYLLESIICRKLLDNKTFSSTVESLRFQGEIDELTHFFDGITGKDGSLIELVHCLEGVTKLQLELVNTKWFKKYKINKIKDINTKALKIIKLFDQNTIYK